MIPPMHSFCFFLPTSLRLKVTLLLSLLWSADAVSAQSLETWYRRALDHHPGLAAQRDMVLAEDTRVRQSAYLPDPMLTFQAFALPVETRLGPQLGGLSIMQTLPWFGTIEAKRDIARFYPQMAGAEEKALRLDVYRELSGVYFDLVELAAEERLLQGQKARWETLAELIDVRYETGRVSLSEVLRLRVEINSLEEQLATLSDRRGPLLSALSRWVGQSIVEVMIPDSLPAVQWSQQEDATWLLVEQHHPAFDQLEYQDQLWAARSALADRERKPSFTVGIGYVMVGERSDANPDQNGRDILQVQAGIRIPLQQEAFRAANQEASLRRAQLHSLSDDLSFTLRQELSGLFQQYREAERKIALYERQTILVEQTLDLQLQQYSVENTGFEDLIRTENQWLEFQFNLTRASLLQHRSVAAIFALSGGPLLQSSLGE